MEFVNADAERCLLGAMFLDNSIIENVLMVLSAEDFGDYDNRKIYQAVQTLNAKGVSVGLNTVWPEMVNTGVLPGTVASITNQVPSGANWDYYCKLVKKHALYRGNAEEIETARLTDITGKDIEAVIENRIKTLTNLLESVNTSRREKTMYEVMLESEKRVEFYNKNKGKLTGFKTGFSKLDFFTDGVQKNLIIIGARPSIGKTSLLETLMLNICELNAVPCAMFEIEMTSVQIGIRAIAGTADLNTRHIRSGLINQIDRRDSYFKMSEAMVKLSQLPFFIDESTNEIHKMARRIRYLARCKGVQVFGIDHLSIIENDNNKKPRHEQMAEVVEILRALKKELNVTIILLAQLIRGAEGEKPKLSDLRETGVAEQSAEDVWMIYRDRQTDIEEKIIPTKLMIMKQREGPCGDVDIYFKTQTVKFVENAGNENKPLQIKNNVLE